MENSTKISKEKRSKKQPDSQNNLKDMEELSSSKDELQTQSPNIVAKNDDAEDTVEDLQKQLETLMNSLAVLSAEKSRMEANFQSEKKQIRSEREEYERGIKNMKEKIKRIHGHATSEVEHFKYKLIMERHEREKEQADHAQATKELQKIIRNEQKAREQLEMQVKELKSSVSTKTQNKILEAELDVLKNKLKQAEAVANETPTMLLSLQSEMSSMKKKHRNAIIEEQKRAAAAEQEAKALAASHESRVVGLEARLAELSDIVGGYDRLRQQDQKAIYKLKDQLNELQSNKKFDNHDSPQELAEKIKNLYFQLLELDKDNSCANIKDLLNNLKLCDKSQDIVYKGKYEAVLTELEALKVNMAPKNSQSHENDDTQLHKEKSHAKNLEEKLRMLVIEMTKKEKDFKTKLEKQEQMMQEHCLKTEQLLAQKNNECLNKIATLEQQLLKQRERSLSVIQEKDKEIHMLKSTFDVLLSRKNISEFGGQSSSFSSKQGSLKNEAIDLTSGLLTADNNTPMIYYTQELARKEVQISGLRKQNMQLEATIRELERNSFRFAEKHEEETKKLDAQIKRLEASKSREGANLEYLKNVVLNYLTTNDSARKCHMLNAITTVLRFTGEEIDKLAKHK
ncbi:GRIP and coiled-coil domain-containing protein 1 [Copidosoma floridanum]|uniref:GRIP and coiled-coil domain-containing protein 1 n=1 Tax=Copidosoma floridanum TaxID=29053 RepID=UPI0006C97928|nr:GRIP and coiled-coil domain-containing protein 1 [Copidosoma floridanum]